jgi:hypothetical protein
MPGFIGFFARRGQVAEREGLSGGFIRSPYISEKSCDHGGLRDTSWTTSRTTFCPAESTAPKWRRPSLRAIRRQIPRAAWLRRPRRRLAPAAPAEIRKGAAGHGGRRPLRGPGRRPMVRHGVGLGDARRGNFGCSTASPVSARSPDACRSPGIGWIVIASSAI